MKAFVTVPSCFHSPRWEKPACPLNFRDVGVATGGATPTRLLPGCKEAEQTAKPTNRSATIPSFPLNGLHAEGHGVRHVVQWKKKRKSISLYLVSVPLLPSYCRAGPVPSSSDLYIRLSGSRRFEDGDTSQSPHPCRAPRLWMDGWMDEWGSRQQQQAATSGSPAVKKDVPYQNHSTTRSC